MATQTKRTVTDRQLDVLRGIAMGHRNSQIAKRLKISVQTVEVHRYDLLRRLDATNAVTLLRSAVRHKLLPRDFAVRELA